MEQTFLMTDNADYHPNTLIYGMWMTESETPEIKLRQQAPQEQYYFLGYGNDVRITEWCHKDERHDLMALP